MMETFRDLLMLRHCFKLIADVLSFDVRILNSVYTFTFDFSSSFFQFFTLSVIVQCKRKERAREKERISVGDKAICWFVKRPFDFSCAFVIL